MRNLFLYPLLIAILAAGTSPWWWNEIKRLVGSEGLPLQIGTYSFASNYITIYQKGSRFCFMGFDAHRYTIASAFEDPGAVNVYRIHGYGNTTLIQKDYETIVFGGTEYKSDDSYRLPTIDRIDDQDVQRCLESSEPFHTQYPDSFQGE